MARDRFMLFKQMLLRACVPGVLLLHLVVLSVWADSKPILQFWDSGDILEPFGKYEISAEPLKVERRSETFPNMQFGCEVPREGNSAWIYGWRMGQSKNGVRMIEMIRTSTADGIHFSNTEFLATFENPKWQGFCNIIYRPTDKSLFLFSWSAGELYVYSSQDGKDWKNLTTKAYSGHDAMCITWFEPWKEFLNYQNALQSFQKRYPDNIGNLRRVLSFRRSKDGTSWTEFRPDFLKDSQYWLPDDNDPFDMEFYRSVVFQVHGRYVMLLLSYIAPPPEANSRRATTKHGPRSSAEWVISRDGLNWNRQFRAVDPAQDLCWVPLQGPFNRSGSIRFYAPSGEIASLPDDRLFYVTCRGNGEFNTQPVTISEKPLYLNADISYRDCEVASNEPGRAYVMVELLDQSGKTIPGFERTKCIFANQNSRNLPLKWEGATLGDLMGKRVQLRFYYRDAKIYGVKTE